jgi:hypothetical protein
MKPLGATRIFAPGDLSMRRLLTSLSIAGLLLLSPLMSTQKRARANPGPAAQQQGAVAQQQGAVAQQQGAVAQQQGAVAQQQGAVAQQQGAVAQQQGAVAQQQGAVAQQQGAVAQQQGAVAQRQGAAALQQAAVAKQQAEATKNAGKAAQAAEATAKAVAEAAQRGESVEAVVNAANIVVDAYELVRNTAGARAARAVANAAGAKAGKPTSSPQDVADVARSWADAIKAAEGQPFASKPSDSTPAAEPRGDLPRDLPPPSAKAAFESALPIGTNPAISAAGDYEYSIFATTPTRPEESHPPSPRRIGFFAVKYGAPESPSLAERYARLAAWNGARAVQTQLVSLANPGLGQSVLLRKSESLVIGFCSFEDEGYDPEHDWFAFERDDRSPVKWRAYRISPATNLQARDQVEDAEIPWFTDARVVLGQKDPLGFYPYSTLLHDHREWRPRPLDPSRAATIRVVISGDVVTFSIEVGMRVYDSFHLAGQYHRDYFPSPDPGSRSAFNERLQYGAVTLRSAAPPSWKTLERAAAYGADVLRRRGESLVGPDELRKERLGDNNHLVLLVRNSRTGEMSWLGMSSRDANGLQVTTKLAQPKQELQRQVLDYPAVSSPYLAAPSMPKGEACSYPLFLGGEAGSRLVEVWIIQNQRTEGHFTGSPTPLFDVQYLFLRPH